MSHESAIGTVKVPFPLLDVNPVVLISDLFTVDLLTTQPALAF